MTVPRGDWHKPAPGFSFTVDQPVTVYLAVDQRGKPVLESEWKPTDLTLTWGENHKDVDLYPRFFRWARSRFPATPLNTRKNAFGMPHLAFVLGKAGFEPQSRGRPRKSVCPPRSRPHLREQNPVNFTIQIDPAGNGQWKDYATVEVPAKGYVSHLLPADFEATWLRLKTNRDTIATAYLHQTAHPKPSDRFRVVWWVWRM